MKFLIFIGTVRDSTPPRPARLGERVAKVVLACLQQRYAQHEYVIVDCMDYPLDAVFKPHFAYPKGKAPDALNQLAAHIASADGYIMVSPEYNHSMSPALANLLNHFGSSLFSYKPSAIVTYSAGQWGGMRAAVNMRSYLAELGCLPVSAMIHVPTAQDAFQANGSVQSSDNTSVEQGQKKWFDYFSRTFEQLMWWAEATRTQRDRVNPHERIGNFTRSPTQRNAP